MDDFQLEPFTQPELEEELDYLLDIELTNKNEEDNVHMMINRTNEFYHSLKKVILNQILFDFIDQLNL